MKVCKNCGEINSGDTMYCSKCGSSDFIYQEEVTCPHCGATNGKSFSHCANCGTELSDASSSAGKTEERAPQPLNVTESNTAVFTKGATIEKSQCPSCGADVTLTSMFCPNCGANVSAIHEHRVVQRRICRHCGRPNPQELHFCSYCFCSLADAKVENLQVVYDHRVLEDGAVRQVYLEGIAGKSIVCPNCGTLNKPDEAFCVNCGLQLAIEEPKKYCPSCGGENAIDSKFCSKCNFSFEPTKPEDLNKWTCKFCGCANEQENVFCSTCGHKRKK